jgi:hypothetical protein
MKKSVFSILFGLSATASLIGAFMKIMHIEGGIILLLSGFVVGTIISPFYSLSQARHIRKLEIQAGEKVQEINSRRKVFINILFFISTVTVLVGAYMVIMELPGAFIVLLCGFPVGFLASSIDNIQNLPRIKELEAQLASKND